MGRPTIKKGCPTPIESGLSCLVSLSILLNKCFCILNQISKSNYESFSSLTYDNQCKKGCFWAVFDLKGVGYPQKGYPTPIESGLSCLVLLSMFLNKCFCILNQISKSNYESLSALTYENQCKKGCFWAVLDLKGVGYPFLRCTVSQSQKIPLHSHI